MVNQVPCFPSSRAKVVVPQDTVPHKNVHRYGETNIRHVERPMRQDEWKKSHVDPNAGRQLPDTPRRTDENEPKRLRRKAHPPTHAEIENEQLSSSMPQYQVPPPPRQQAPLMSDFYVSVPIFNETLDHSYRKKNEYTYTDRDDTSSVFHQSLSRASSLRDLNSDRRPPTGLNQSHHLERRQTRPKQRTSLKQHRPRSGSEASYNTHSSYTTTHSYESEQFEAAKVLKRHPSASRTQIDSDEDMR